MFIPHGASASSPKKINITCVLNLRALWRKYFTEAINFNPQSSNVNEESNETTAEIPTQVPAQVPSQAVLQIHALHDKHRNLNPELVNEKKNGEEMAENYAKVKILQKIGWSFQNPPMKEIHTIKKALTKRQQESIYKHQQKRVDELIQLLLNRGVSPQQSEVSLPTQMQMSVTKEEFYLDFAMLGQLIRDDPSYASIKLPHENLGALSILTGNDKIPAFRSCTKNLAFTQFQKQAELGNAMSLVNPVSKKFENHEHCIAAYR